ncbi:hypothetical protein D3C83_211190 [compost metagenome]
MALFNSSISLVKAAMSFSLPPGPLVKSLMMPRRISATDLPSSWALVLISLMTSSRLARWPANLRISTIFWIN